MGKRELHFGRTAHRYLRADFDDDGTLVIKELVDVEGVTREVALSTAEARELARWILDIEGEG